MAPESRKGIACGGNWIIDLVKVIDHYPPENSITYIRAESMGGGGCAYNVIINLAKFDPAIDLYALGVIGNDPYGDYIVNECRQYPNIHTEQLKRTTLAGTSYTDVFNVKSTGKRTFFHYRGANDLFSPEYVDLEKLPVKLFHLGYLLLLDAMDQPDPQYKTVAARFLAQVQSKNVKTSLDLVSENSDRFTRIVPPALKYTNYCIINDFEAEKLAGIPIRDADRLVAGNLRRIATKIFDFGVNELVVIHFPEGAYLLTKDHQEIFQPSLDLPATFIVGSTGAGDSFCAGMLYGLYQGWPHDQALRFAICAGGLNLSDLTTTGAMKSWQEVFEMERKFPPRPSVL
jgi:sugar/nucleoside kinase (ribokinase family)